MGQTHAKQEQVKFWRDPALQNLEWLRARYITHAFSRHSHDEYAIGVIESGVEAFTYRGSFHQATAGALVIIHPGEVHTGHAGDPTGWAYRMLYPAVPLVQQAAVELGLTPSVEPYFPNPIIYDAPLAQRFCQLHKTLEQSTSCLERESHFIETMAQMIERHGEVRSHFTPKTPTDIGLVQPLKLYLQERCCENISLVELAQVANLPPLKLLRTFRKVVGLPPHAYLIQLRVQRAKQLLAAGLPIAAVAAETGFADQSHLHRHFKRLVGVTPGQYAIGGLRGRRVSPQPGSSSSGLIG